MAGREKRPLGTLFGLNDFGVNLTTLEPGAVSSLRHAHTTQDEFVYLLEGELVLVTNAGETVLRPGMCAGFQAGNGDAHHLVNRSQEPASFLEIGTRGGDDSASYPDDDIVAALDEQGRWTFTRKDGSPYA